MKKGIVLEQHRNYTIVMSNDGLIEKAKVMEGIDIGFEVEYEPIRKQRWISQWKNMIPNRTLAMVCAFLIALLPIYMVFKEDEIYAYVDIDINPSIELEINRDLEVARVIPFNDDAEILIEEIGKLKGKDIEEAVEIIMSTCESKGIVNSARNVLIGVHYIDAVEKDIVNKRIDEHLEKKYTDWEIVTITIPNEVRMVAEKSNQSMNKTLVNQFGKSESNEIKSIVTAKENEVLQSFFNKNNNEVKSQNNQLVEDVEKPILSLEEDEIKKTRPEEILLHEMNINNDSNVFNRHKDRNLDDRINKYFNGPTNEQELKKNNHFNQKNAEKDNRRNNAKDDNLRKERMKKSEDKDKANHDKRNKDERLKWKERDEISEKERLEWKERIKESNKLEREDRMKNNNGKGNSKQKEQKKNNDDDKNNDDRKQKDREDRIKDKKTEIHKEKKEKQNNKRDDREPKKNNKNKDNRGYERDHHKNKNKDNRNNNER